MKPSIKQNLKYDFYSFFDLVLVKSNLGKINIGKSIDSEIIIVTL